MLLTADFKVEKVSPSRFLSLLPGDVTVSEYNPYREKKVKKTGKKRKLKTALEKEEEKKSKLEIGKKTRSENDNTKK